MPHWRKSGYPLTLQLPPRNFAFPDIRVMRDTERQPQSGDALPPYGESNPYWCNQTSFQIRRLGHRSPRLWRPISQWVHLLSRLWQLLTRNILGPGPATAAEGFPTSSYPCPLGVKFEDRESLQSLSERLRPQLDRNSCMQISARHQYFCSKRWQAGNIARQDCRECLQAQIEDCFATLKYRVRLRGRVLLPSMIILGLCVLNPRAGYQVKSAPIY